MSLITIAKVLFVHFLLYHSHCIVVDRNADLTLFHFSLSNHPIPQN